MGKRTYGRDFTMKKKIVHLAEERLKP